MKQSSLLTSLSNLAATMDITDLGIAEKSTTSELSAANDIDDLELEAVGYQREMPRQFTVFSLMSLSFALSCTWSGTGSSMGISLTEASSAGTVWSIPIAGVMTAIVTAGMAELSSAYPVAGAQYYWSFMVSSEKHRAFAAYTYVMPTILLKLQITHSPLR